MKTREPRANAIAIAALLGFVGGMITMGLFLVRAPASSARGAGGPGDDCGPSTFEARPDPGAETARAGKPAATPDAPTPRPEAPVRPAPEVAVLSADPLAELRDRGLIVPVSGVKASDLSSTFSQKRGSDRLHEALDILAPRDTKVLAVEDGTLVKFFFSKAGGNTIYQFDPASTYAYYYAHLDRYAAGLKEGDRVRKGDVIGYVGTTGNAPKDTPHLHFAIFRLTDKKQWWQGTPIDPYDVWR